jgi:glycosyltransferase involved in cell wall biosynthesis
MKVLIVHSGTQNIRSAYINEQVNSLIDLGLEINYFPITKKGLIGYLSHLPLFCKIINEFKPDIVHAHYGLSGLFANLQRKIPVITSFHGSDVYNPRNLLLSKIAYYLSKDTIFVSSKLMSQFGSNNENIITCGVDMTLFKPADQEISKEIFILFGGAKENSVKNFSLAKKGVERFNFQYANSDLYVSIKELKGKSRNEVVDLMNDAKLLLITSFYEGSSQVLKEAMSCNCPVVATDVGSVGDLIGENSKAGIIVESTPESIASGIQKILSDDFSCGRIELIKHEISLEQVAQRVLKLYNSVISSTSSKF